jgi:5'(3')-deoxyribonucleotidase
MARQIIAIDIDDVIADSTEALRLKVNEKTGASLTREHYQVEGEYWGYYERVWTAHGLKDKVPKGMLDSEMIADQSYVLLLPGVSFAIGELSKRFDIALVTARHKEWEEATHEWLKEHFGNVFIDVHFAGNLRMGHTQTKGELCKEVGAKWLIDDNPMHCKTALDEGLQGILFGEYGWHYELPEGLVHCKDWPAVLEYFDAIG